MLFLHTYINAIKLSKFYLLHTITKTIQVHPLKTDFEFNQWNVFSSFCLGYIEFLHLSFFKCKRASEHKFNVYINYNLQYIKKKLNINLILVYKLHS